MKPLTGLIIMDGFGIPKDGDINAIKNAGTPNLDRLKARFPNTNINASGLAVGLPDGQMGNSEVGHLNIGAGRIVYQELTRISVDIEKGGFFKKAEFLDAIENCKRHKTSLHLIGLLSDGGVHSHIEHLFALIKLAKQEGLKDVYVHCLLDGRDVSPTSGKGYVEQLQEFMAKEGIGKIATVMGRYYAMDRDNRWERVKRAYDAMVLGKGAKASDPAEAVRRSYDAGETDEFVQPVVIDGAAPVSRNDSVIFFNFRPDRAREITRSHIFGDFDGFEREKGFFELFYVSMTQYDKTFADKLNVAYKPQTLSNIFGEYISSLGLKQLRIAETEKYAHVTFFFNGGVEAPYPGEDRALIPSPKVATYDLKPEMSAYEVTDEIIARIESGAYDVIIMNYANCDMVGHTGILEAAIKAVGVVDECVGRVVDKILEVGGKCVITADHGNADKMMDVTGEPFTAHTVNQVPLILADPAHENAALREDGRLADIAPTLLDMMDIEKPSEMEGESLIKK